MTVFVAIFVVFLLIISVVWAYMWFTRLLPQAIEHNRIAELSMGAVGVEADVDYLMVTEAKYAADPGITDVIVMPKNFNASEPVTYGFINHEGTYYPFSLEALHGVYFGLAKEGSDASTFTFYFNDYNPSQSFQWNINKNGKLPKFSFNYDFYQQIAHEYNKG